MRKAFVYRIIAPTGKSYIGVTINLAHRLWKHEHANTVIGRSLRKYGRDAHRIDVLVETTEEYAYELEPQLIELYGTLAPDGLNRQIGGFAGMRNFGHTPETCRRISEIKRKYYGARGGRTAAERAKISAGCRGRPKGPMPQAQKDAIRAGHLRRTRQTEALVAG